MSSIRQIVLFLVCTSFLPFLTALNSQKDFTLAIQAIEKYLRTGKPPTALHKYQLTRLFRDYDPNVFNGTQICDLCNVVVNGFIIQRRKGVSRETIAQEAEYLCIHLGMDSGRACIGTIKRNIEVFIYHLDHNVTSERFCGTILQLLGCPRGDVPDWSIRLPNGNSQSKPKPTTDGKSFKVLQIPDVHYDPFYTPHGNAKCSEPLCCQKDQGKPNSAEDGCGFWTDYRYGDTPWHLVEETVRQVKTQNFSYVYFIGDVISHRFWETSIKRNSKTLSKFYSFLKTSFDKPVFPVFGNHDTHPVHLWTPANVSHEFSLQWLFELAAELWSQLIGEDVRKTVRKGGYYTVSPRPGFRIIAINSNVAYTFNNWLVLDDVDPYGQLQWMTDILKKSEDNGETVHILSHVPSGTPQTLSVWGREYSRIVQRFAGTITGQFNGHTHKDEFCVYYNKSAQPVGVAFNGGSITPYVSSNPCYKIYDVDSKTFSLKDYEEWTFNVTLANSQGSPEWYQLYRFTEAYGADSLEPAEVDKVLRKMANDHSLLDDYFKFKVRNADPGVKGGCDETCKKENLCEMGTTVYGDNIHCKRFLELYDQGK